MTKKGLSVNQEAFPMIPDPFPPSVTLSAAEVIVPHLPGQPAFPAAVCADGGFHTIPASVNSMLDAGFEPIHLWTISPLENI